MQKIATGDKAYNGQENTNELLCITTSLRQFFNKPSVKVFGLTLANIKTFTKLPIYSQFWSFPFHPSV